MKNEPKTTVILQIFSGRPDPKWELEAEEAKLLLEKLRQAKSSKATQEVPNISRLGYRGFRVVTAGKKKKQVEEFMVFSGRIITAENRELTAVKDTENLEQQLMDEARKHGYGELMDKVINPDRM